jgi:aquaporin Z
MTITTSTSVTRAGVAPHRLHPQRILAAAVAEFAGTYLLVLAVVGTALLSANDDDAASLNAGVLGVASALGASVIISAIAFGAASGGHFNPAVSLGLAVAGHLPWRSVPAYVIAQVAGGVAASATLAAVLAGVPGGFLAKAQSAGFASTGWGMLSPTDASVGSAFVVEFVCTGLLVAVILGASATGVDSRLIPFAVGLTLFVVAVVAIPVSNGSFNPARSVASAVFGGAEAALPQLWLSVVAPICGAIAAGALSLVAGGGPRLGRDVRAASGGPH